MNFPPREFEEGRLEWVDPKAVSGLGIPKTDRDVIWPLVQEHSMMLGAGKGGGKGTGAPEVFSVHIDCADAECFVVTREHPR